LSVFGGYELLRGIVKFTDKAKELSHELTQIQVLNKNMTPLQFEQIKDWAYGLPSRVRGTTSVEALKQFGAVQSMFGQEGALKMGDTIAQFGQVLGSQSGNWEGTSDKILKMIRAGDLMGKFTDTVTHKVDLDKLQRFLDLGIRVVNATHGMVSPATWFALAQQGGPALSNMTDEGLMSMAMAAQGMGGYRAGTAMTSLFQQMVGGKMTQYAAQELQTLGLVGGYSVGQGGRVLWDKGALETPFAKSMQADPLAATEMLRKALTGGGFTTIEQQVPELFKMFGRQTTQRLVHDFLRNYPQMIGERGRLESGMGVFGAGAKGNEEDYLKVMHNLSAAWEDMVAKAALPAAQAAIPIMNAAGDFFLGMGRWAVTPEGAAGLKQIAEGMTLLGAFMIGGGAIAVLAAMGPGGWVLGGLLALAVWAVENKDTFKSIADSAIGFMDKIQKAITDGFQGILDWISAHIPEWVKKWATSFEGGGFGGGGNGITKASWGGGSSAGALSAGESGVAQQEGVDPAALLKIYGTEGRSAWMGDLHDPAGPSYGPFQLNTSGLLRGYHGPREKSAAAVEAMAHYVARYGKSHGGWSSDIWHGLRGHGGSIPYHQMRQNIEHPAAKGQVAVHIQPIIELDGNVIHRAVEKRIVAASTHITSAPYLDTSRRFVSPDIGFVSV